MLCRAAPGTPSSRTSSSISRSPCIASRRHEDHQPTKSNDPSRTGTTGRQATPPRTAWRKSRVWLLPHDRRTDLGFGILFIPRVVMTQPATVRICPARGAGGGEQVLRPVLTTGRPRSKPCSGAHINCLLRRGLVDDRFFSFG